MYQTNLAGKLNYKQVSHLLWQPVQSERLSSCILQNSQVERFYIQQQSSNVSGQSCQLSADILFLTLGYILA
jgi:hypothetical protein